MVIVVVDVVVKSLIFFFGDDDTLLVTLSGCRKLDALAVGRCDQLSNMGFSTCLAPVCHQITSLVLDHTNIEDTGLIALCCSTPRMKILDLWYCDRVTDLGLQDSLSCLHFLEQLVLDQVQVTDTGLVSLHGQISYLLPFS
mgnify:CR=1 FL=1